MSSKESRLKINSKKEHLWLKRMAECSDEMYNRLTGKILTTLEATLPGSRQLEALKERARDIQGEFSDSMNQDSYSMFAHWFTVSDETPDEKPTEEYYNTRVSEYWGGFENMVIKKFDRLSDTLTNLVVIAIEGQERQEALKSEIRRIVDISSLKLRSWLGRGLNEVLLERR